MPNVTLDNGLLLLWSMGEQMDKVNFYPTLALYIKIR